MVCGLGCRTGGLLCEKKGADLVVNEGRTLTCEEAGTVIEYVENLTLGTLDGEDRQGVYREVSKRFEEPSVNTRVWLASMKDQSGADRRVGLRGAERHATRLHQALAGRGVLGEREGPLWSIMKKKVVIWGMDDAEQLVLTENAIEGWIRYASLCREAQGARGLRVSIADRVKMYRDLQRRFEFGSRQEKIALAALGPYWEQIEHHWVNATYGEQQAWILSAPLPPPMTATSLGYAQQIIESDVVAHVQSLDHHFGPLSLDKMIETDSQAEDP